MEQAAVFARFENAYAKSHPVLQGEYNAEAFEDFLANIGYEGVSVVAEEPVGFFRHDAYYDHEADRIVYVPDFYSGGTTYAVVLHELAHSVHDYMTDTHQSQETAHGKEFAAVYTYLVAEFEAFLGS